jgi:hypothetical protein
MNQQKRSLRERSMGCFLQALAAALLSISPAAAVAPPPRAPEVPGPGPLFAADEFHTDPVRMALAVLGTSGSPIGNWGPAFVLSAGDHPRVRAWELKGPLTNLYSRRACGTAALFLAGFQGDAGLSAFATLGTLKAGHFLECWALRDTDRFFGLPKEWMDAVNDGQGIPVGGLEADIYSRVLTLANYTSTAAFQKAARKDIAYVHIYNEPEVYRGKVVHVEGILKRINRFDPPPEAAEKGVNDLYEAWVFPTAIGISPYCVVFTEWPANLPRDLLGKETIAGTYTVSMDGYFFKKFRFVARDGKRTEREAPLLIGHSLVVARSNIQAGEDTTWLRWVVTGIVGVFGVVLAAVVGLTWWFRRNDARIRRRLLTAHSTEFVLPPPDALPVVAPPAPPIRRIKAPSQAALPPRITFPAGSGDRGSAPPSGGEGGKRGSGDKSPEEGAGP